jgi:hypothetical protein
VRPEKIRRIAQTGDLRTFLANFGKTNAKSVPRNILQLALLYELGEGYLVGMPLLEQRAVFGALAGVARWRGVEKALEKYL